MLSSSRTPRKRGGRKLRKRTRKWNATNRTVVRTLDQVCPDEVDVILTYPAAGTLHNASLTVSQRWTPNAAYDVDPTLGSTSTPGFSEWAAMYTYYRVVSYDVDMMVSNLEAFPLIVYSINTNEDPHLLGTGFIDYQTQPFSKTAIIGSLTGAANARFHHHVPCAKLLGSNAVDTADSLRAVTTGVPADLLWYGLGIQAPPGSLCNNGVLFNLKIRMNIKFYGRQNLDVVCKSER